MALFESYERREKQILAKLNEYGIGSIEEAEKITKDAGLDVYHMIENIPIEAGELALRVLPRHQGIERLIYVAGQSREGSQLAACFCFQFIQRGVPSAKIRVDAILQLRGAQHAVCLVVILCQRG